MVAGIFYGIKPAVTAIVLQAAHRIGSRALKNGWLWAIAAAAFVAIFALQLPFPLIVVTAATLGWLGGRYLPDAFALGGGHGGKVKARTAPALIDDDTLTPEHARFRWMGLLNVVAVGALLWGLALARVLAALARHEIFHAEATVAVLLVVGLPRALSAPLRWLARWLRSRSPISRLAAAP